jgi:hypothetical protein
MLLPDERRRRGSGGGVDAIARMGPKNMVG